MLLDVWVSSRLKKKKRTNILNWWTRGHFFSWLQYFLQTSSKPNWGNKTQQKLILWEKPKSPGTITTDEWAREFFIHRSLTRGRTLHVLVDLSCIKWSCPRWNLPVGSDCECIISAKKDNFPSITMCGHGDLSFYQLHASWVCGTLLGWPVHHYQCKFPQLVNPERIRFDRRGSGNLGQREHLVFLFLEETQSVSRLERVKFIQSEFLHKGDQVQSSVPA